MLNVESIQRQWLVYSELASLKPQGFLECQLCPWFINTMICKRNDVGLGYNTSVGMPC
jgi:hypothetical protein